jgi:hypothetical protein
MKNLKALSIFSILIVLAIAGNLFAQTYDRQQPQGQGPERFGPMPPPFSSMAISPDSKYLYIFYNGRIYQYELPNLKLIKSASIDSGVDSRR